MLEETVYITELMIKAGRKRSTPNSWKSYSELPRIGAVVFCRKRDLPKFTKDIYLNVWDKCHDMTNYYPFTKFCEEIGVSDSYFSDHIKKEIFEYDMINIGHNKFIRVPNEILERWNQGKIVHLITQQKRKDCTSDYENCFMVGRRLYGYY